MYYTVYNSTIQSTTYNTANGIYYQNVMNHYHECEPHKRKIDIEKKIQYKNTLDSLQTNCVVMKLPFTIYVKRYKAISFTKSCKRVNHTWCKRSESFWQTLHHLLCAA